ncbi:tannase/feruloyl esterase family alpha/beta hydrolase [Marinobacter salarius]|uniref:tannase/feruloyl esterase family alpha/beta hydrolase n=1 Tax=Marinobacter salarius TaxID=1420917 RepID=UPI00273BB6C5|nr:tannase/feruloyl esterase family alpha/beta hydrolase [Marinobacter salarius]MDP4532885.1 tannase/feruloyl esterase family alpha/beta hydrolase [Marinobacter salarius]
MSRRIKQALPRSTLTLTAGLFLTIALVGCNDSDSDGASSQITAEAQCEKFTGKTYGEATITSSTFVPTKDDIPEHCLVYGEMEKDLDFEVRMPTDWNGRTVFAGGGGFDGSIADVTTYRSLSPDLAQRGYATIATNHGHTSGDYDGQSWALDEQMLKDYAYRSVPRVMSPASQVLTARYGAPWTNSKTVYEGCSGGGRQALMQAQRHPDLFDGIISRAPANDFTGQFLWYQKVLKQFSQPGAGLSDAKIRTLSDAILAKCDADDGLKDGILGQPNSCDFDPSELACTGGESDDCLTAPQIESVRTFFAGVDIADGRYTWATHPPGSEFRFDFGAWADDGTGTRREGAAAALMNGYIKYMVARDPSVDPLELDPTEYTDRIDELVKLIDATDPDLTEFKNNGGKLILWTGLSDSLITANNATEYYQNVVTEMGGQDVVDGFMEYYTSPGVDHCNGGAGADKIDLIEPMFQWLEQDTPPSNERILATQYDTPEGELTKNRPVCQYPKYPRYIEGGDLGSAASFKCVLPD